MIVKRLPYLLLLLISGCGEFGFPMWIETLHPDEAVLCTSQANRVLIGKPDKTGMGTPEIHAWAQVYSDKSSRLYAAIEAAPQGEDSYSKRKLVGKDLTKEDTFQFADTTWKIKELGFHGIYVKQLGQFRNERLCPRGFILIQQISPTPTLKRHPMDDGS
jgi:hypothetical protein